MRRFLGLPASLLLLLLGFATDTAESSVLDIQQGDLGNSSIRDANHRTENENYIATIARREARANLQAGFAPVAMRKMSADEGEMFFPEYWGFDQADDNSNLQEDSGIYERHMAEPLAPIALHVVPRLEEVDVPKQDVHKARTLNFPSIFRRASCPVGTNSCTSIGYPNSCCSSAQTCIVITDSGLGPVGCCPSGSTCSGSISSCAAGNTACPSSLGGGCCIPGYVCSGVGCIQSVVVTSTSIFSIVKSSTTQMVTSTITTTTTPIVVTSSLSTSITTIIETSSSTTTVLTSPSADTTSTVTAIAPVRPTSTEATVIEQTTTTSQFVAAATDGTCPTGFYVCSAYYQGGCCRVGRDCNPTSCPQYASTTLLSSGVTIVVPLTGAATTTASATCANGWQVCATSLGGGCCPSGWACGTASCSSIGPTNTAVQSKEAQIFGSSGRRERAHATSTLCLGLVIVVVVFILF